MKKILFLAAMLSTAVFFNSCRNGAGGLTDGDTTPDCYIQITNIPSGVSILGAYLTDEPITDFTQLAAILDAVGIVGAADFSNGKAALVYVNAQGSDGHYWGGGSKYVSIIGEGGGSMTGMVYRTTASKKSFSRGTTTVSYNDFTVNLLPY